MVRPLWLRHPTRAQRTIREDATVHPLWQRDRPPGSAAALSLPPSHAAVVCPTVRYGYPYTPAVQAQDAATQPPRTLCKAVRPHHYAPAGARARRFSTRAPVACHWPEQGGAPAAAPQPFSIRTACIGPAALPITPMCQSAARQPRTRL